MPISSLIVRFNTDKTNEVTQSLTNIQNVSISEVHNENMVLITETNKQSEDKALWNEIEQIPGVIKCDLIYHNFEDEEGFDYER